MGGVDTLDQVLDRRTREGELYERLPEGRVRCYACGHRCLIPPGQRGICKVRFNDGGRLMVPSGYVAALQLDPIEKKPFFHVLPGARALSFGMLGCDFHCSFCQNWLSSQALRDPAAGAPPTSMTPEEFVRLARGYDARVVTSTYNEPLITSEWAVEIFRAAKAQGLLCSYVSNGNGTPEVLDYLRPWVDAFKVDLKAFDDRTYRKLGGLLSNVLDTIRLLYQKGFWVEVVTLVVPGLNDSDRELREIARFLVSVSPEIPWHVTAFHQDYKMTDRGHTQVNSLLRAAEIGLAEGLRFVYAGNLPGCVGPYEDTRCPGCGTLLVKRIGYTILRNEVVDGTCRRCHVRVPGIWS